MLHIKYRLDLLWFSLDASLSDHRSEKLSYCDAKHAFTRIQLHAMIVEVTEGLFQVGNVVGFFETFNRHIIDIDLHVSMNLIFENCINSYWYVALAFLKLKGIIL